ncbi:LysR family transcriptional regulator [Bradyrhizobium sp. CCGB01]|uniref:LysR family transcriptional regulator n=1 Tax=Bradyrhizobium sp. CCGB01 TaxID=2949634 RepID=UPI0020B1D811|nr:LysR family transcriptional regulator [Bradyrhizobium sp. CCGB01]MCP3408250.1 LysR family transcriptional regulator [Bradyrhizobium sp. CCGB01]
MADIRTVDLNLLKALDALLDERSVTRAGERLALSQPAVSGMLTRLRDVFGDPLFVRAQRGVVPTARAAGTCRPCKAVARRVRGIVATSAF